MITSPRVELLARRLLEVDPGRDGPGSRRWTWPPSLPDHSPFHAMRNVLDKQLHYRQDPP